MKRSLLALVAVSVTASAGTFEACDDTGSYPFQARPLDDGLQCLGPGAVLDILSGSDPGLGCAPRCFVATEADDAGLLTAYGSTMCGPPPGGYDTSEADPRCPVAKAAVSRSDVCTDDGGQTAPLLPDASLDSGEASSDAAPLDDGTAEGAPDGSND